MIGRKLHGRGDALIRIPLQILALDHHVTDVIVVPKPEAMMALVECVPILGISGCRLNLELIGSKTKIGAEPCDVHWRNFRMIWKVQRPTGLSELLRISARGSIFRIGAIDPVVDPV